MPTDRPRILVTDHLEPSAVDRLRTVGEVTVIERCDEPQLASMIREFDALVVRTYTRVTGEVLARAGRLRVIGRAGVGIDNIDVQAARKKGITVVHTPAAATEAVADLTVGLIIDLHRSITRTDAMIRAGRFQEARNKWLATELSELTLGIIGLGRIGKAVARRCRHGFKMPVIYNDIVDPGRLDFTATRVELEELLRRADVISLHVPLTPKTRQAISRDTLELVKSSSMLVNTARGAVIDSLALAASLGDGSLRGAGLDVVDPEPLPPDHPLLAAHNVVFTPHIGARTIAAQERMSAVVDDVIAVLTGKTPRFPCTDQTPC